MKCILIKNATLINERKTFIGDILIKGERIEQINPSIEPDIYCQVVDADGHNTDLVLFDLNTIKIIDKNYLLYKCR